MIRVFSPSDLDRILQIEARSFPKSPYDWGTFVDLHFLYPETFLVYVDKVREGKEEEILGYIIYSGDGHIISIAVDPNYRRRGVGTQLLKRAMNTPRVKKVWAEVRRSNQGAQAFYFREGFQIVGVIPDYYGNEDALILQRTPSRS